MADADLDDKTREADLDDKTREADLDDKTREADLDDETRKADRGEPQAAPGWLRALVVGGLTVDAVLAAAVISFLLPSSLADVVFRSPLLILVLITGTAVVLWTITRPRPIDR